MKARIIVTIRPAGRLYVIATPIGNLGDLSARARDTLASCSVIAAEDTRHTGGLLQHAGVKASSLISLHDHNEGQRAPDLVARLLDGSSVALVSDAGTPAISDPGFELVRAAVSAQIEVVAIPGPCAAIAALSIGGLPTDRFCFEGFLPARGSARRTRLGELAEEPRTLVFYESPHRVVDTLEDCAATFGGPRPAVVAREITKLHETTYRGTLDDLLARARNEPDFARGEIVLLVSGAAATRGEGGEDGYGGELDRILTVLMTELPLKQAAGLAAKLTGARDNQAYKRALRLKGGV